MRPERKYVHKERWKDGWHTQTSPQKEMLCIKKRFPKEERGRGGGGNSRFFRETGECVKTMYCANPFWKLSKRQAENKWMNNLFSVSYPCHFKQKNKAVWKAGELWNWNWRQDLLSNSRNVGFTVIVLTELQILPDCNLNFCQRELQYSVKDSVSLRWVL